jgi:hypothetical protein
MSLNLRWGAIEMAVPIEEAMIDVGPKLFEDKSSRIDSDVQSPLCACVGKAAFTGGIVEP